MAELQGGTPPIPPDVNRGTEILAICSIVVGIALVLVILRLWVRLKIVGAVGWDDHLMSAAMIILFVEMMVIIPEVHYGAGRHYHYIQPPENIRAGLLLNFVTQPLCIVALTLVKLSVGMFLLRVIPMKVYRWVIVGIMVFSTASSLGGFFTVFFQCRPLAMMWDNTVDGTCIPATHLRFASLFNSALSAFTDFVFALLPIPMILKVQVNWKVKTALCGILSLGLFATVAAVVKITHLENYGKYSDLLFDSADITIWTTVEICTAVAAASIPCLKPLFKRMLAGSSYAKYASSNTRPSRKSNGTSNRTPRGTSRSIRAYEMDMGPRTQTRVRGRPNTPRRVNPDNLSEDSILESGDGIMKSMQVSVTVDEYEARRPKDLV